MEPKCPKDKKEWEAAAKASGVDDKTLSTWPNLHSASQVTRDQYILYRVLCPEPKPSYELDISQFGIPRDCINEAQTLLQDDECFKLYLQRIGTDNWAGPQPQLGAFKTVLRLQSEIRKGPKFGDSYDEDTVNSALIELLNALTFIIADTTDWWRTYKRQFKFSWGEVKGFTARTDGQLEDRNSQFVKVIIECKRRLSGQANHVIMQEVSELVAWIKGRPSSPASGPIHYHPSVGQYGAEMFIKFLEYGAPWTSYLERGCKDEGSFAILHSCGAYPMDDPVSMWEFAVNIVAMSLFY
ncbi:hypothetical protein AbraIFM66950_004744 [Aspergillus brasiliensis]|nr:hypothetical protein AbraIFM66950_004744 [Aspergillus brasiliensis]